MREARRTNAGKNVFRRENQFSSTFPRYNKAIDRQSGGDASAAIVSNVGMRLSSARGSLT